MNLGNLFGNVETDTEKLRVLAVAADGILREELGAFKIEHDFAEVRVLSRKTVGVQGDGRTYQHPAVIEVRYKSKLVWNEEFVRKLSTRITNEVQGINRVTYTFAK